MFTKSHKSIAIFFAYFYLHVFAYKYLNLIYILCVFLSFLDTNFSQVHSVRCWCMSIIRIHLKNIRTNIKIGITHPHCILVGIRDFQAKSGESRQNRDSWTVWWLIPYPLCFTLLAPTSHPIKIPELPPHQTNQNYHLSFHLLFLRSVAKMCRAAISNSFLRWATSCGQYRRRPSIPPTMFCE